MSIFKVESKEKTVEFKGNELTLKKMSAIAVMGLADLVKDKSDAEANIFSVAYFIRHGVEDMTDEDFNAILDMPMTELPPALELANSVMEFNQVGAGDVGLEDALGND